MKRSSLTRSLLASTFVLALAGCMTTPTPSVSQAPAIASIPAKPKSPPKPTPVCTNAKQCEAMWLEAQDAVQTFGGMKLQLVTANRLQTYNPTSMTKLGAEVVKKPTSADAYEIRVAFACKEPSAACDDYRDAARDLFNMTVARAGEPFATPEKPATPSNTGKPAKTKKSASR